MRKLDGILDSILEHSIAMGVPCILGERGMEKVIELQLNDSETALFKQSVSYIRSDLERMASL
jgi:malate dehydrogenase